ncbi:uncharacterized protein LOC127846086 [Dreissena polymorpha]|nr:uncharacterized protein LOC127846086 [Dreissena polymorpha]
MTPSRTNKRKLTPLKSPIKTPFKSPIYKARAIGKRCPSSRSLFGMASQVDRLTGTDLDENLNVVNGADGETLVINENTNNSNKRNNVVGDVEFDNNLQEVTQEMLTLVPEVVSKLAKTPNAIHLIILAFFRQVKNDAFPLDNIAFLLWLEVVSWYNCGNTKRMRYLDTTKLFWKLGWRMFGGRFINFMCGYKNQQSEKNDFSDDPKCSFDPASSRINFVVPDEKVLRKSTPYTEVTDRKPGFYGDIMVHMGESLFQQSACLTFDGKKIKQGLTKYSGDVDLLGFEDSSSLQERLLNVEMSTSEYDAFICYLQQYKNTQNLESISTECRHKLKQILGKSLRETSAGIVEASALKKKKEYAKEKLIEKGGGGLAWKESKFSYAISSVIGFLHDIDKYLLAAEMCIKSICLCLCSLNDTPYISDVNINLSECENYFPLEVQKEDENNTRLLPQRTEKWFEIRKKAKVTGSTIHKAIGLDGVKKLKDYFELVKCNIPEQEVNAKTKENMQHGTINEINAVATIVTRIMPIVTPELVFCEEGCVQVFDEDSQPFLVVSPDGSLRLNKELSSTKVAVEIKCPVNGVHTFFPSRYYLQCQAEIAVLNVEWLLYVSWTENTTSAFKVLRNDDIFRRAMKTAMCLYNGNETKKPTKIGPEIKQLQYEIEEQSKSVEFLGLFPSAKACSASNMNRESASSIKTFMDVINQVKNTHNDLYELTRERATEAVVFLCTDLDRNWKKEELKCAPVAWFPKGYSLKTTTMRTIAEHVHNMCHDAGIHVPCQSFDGQWHNIIVRSLTNSPLTVLALQKDVWNEVQKMKKSDIITALKQFNRNPVILRATTIDKDHKSKTTITFVNGLVRVPLLYATERKEESGNSNVAGDNNLNTRHNIDDSENNRLIDNREIQDNNNEDTNEVCRQSNDQIGDEINTTDMSDEHEDNSNEHGNGADEPLHQNIKEHDLLDKQDVKQILLLLKVDKTCNLKGKWNSVTEESLSDCFSCTEKLKKLLNSELAIILHYLKKVKRFDIKRPTISTKQDKLIVLSRCLKLQYPEQKQKRPLKQVMLSLSELASKVLISKTTKQSLNRIYAELLWPKKYSTWKENGTVQTNLILDGICAIKEWFYQPEYSERRSQLEVRCIDATHLLTRTRRKSCHGGLDNSRKESWLNVAKTGKTRLTPIMVEEVSDPMSASMAATHFSEEVEREMIHLGDEKTADLCRDIRLWWAAEDTAGISAKDRVVNRLMLRNRLINNYDFGSFPPATMYINGWPIQLWEALIAHIDAKIILYSLCHGGTYNVRAFSSLAGETFFSELTLNDRRGQGTVTTEEFGRFVGNSIEQMQARLDPDRPFIYRTGRSHKYHLLEKSKDLSSECDQNCAACVSRFRAVVTDITIKDHFFDHRKGSKKKGGTVDMDRNSIQKGALGVRWEKARRNDSKMLVTSKMGLTDVI